MLKLPITPRYKVKSMLRILIGIAVIAALLLIATLQWQEPSRPEFIEIGSFTADGNAEIVQVAADGSLAVFTNAERQSIDVVDLSDPTNPVALATVEVPGEPTSVALSPDAKWALTVVHVTPADEGAEPADLRLPGVLGVIDLREPAAAKLVSVIGIGNHPDSIAVTDAGDSLVAVIAIENEPVIVNDNIVIDSDNPDNGTDISAPGVVQIVTINPDSPRNWSVVTLEIAAELLTHELMLFADDPQPEYVAMSPGRHMAAVSLQENNGILLIDLGSAEISGAFSLGTVVDRPADLLEDGQINLTQAYPSDAANHALAGIRSPDAISFSPDGQYLLSADEGELPMTGGRGFSIWTLTGEFVWDDGGEIERKAVAAGLYPDTRSENNGIEIEGITSGRFGDRDFAFAVSERGSFLVIYDISNPYAPEFIQLLPTGEHPESVVAIPEKNLIVVAAEKSGTLTIYRYESSQEESSLLQSLLN